jgi:hypothetical protein
MPNRKRHSNTERVGVNKVESFFIEEFDWIFRPQDISDYGIDAIVEQSINGNPTGKLLALQIKSGDSHFYKNKNGELVFYFTNVHYEYWINLDIPVLLIGYLSSKNLIWSVVNHNTVRRTKSNYSLHFKEENQLKKESIKEIEMCFLEIKRGTYLVDDFIYDYTKEINNKYSVFIDSYKTNYAAKSLSLVMSHVNEVAKEFGEVKKRIKTLKGKSNQLNPSFSYIEMSRWATSIEISAARINSELKIFSFLIGRGISAHVENLERHNIDSLKKKLIEVNIAIEGISKVIIEVEKLTQTIEMWILFLDQEKLTLSNSKMVYNNLLNELVDAKNLFQYLKDNIDYQVSKS